MAYGTQNNGTAGSGRERRDGRDGQGASLQGRYEAVPPTGKYDSRERLGPWLDPIQRRFIGTLAKWALLLGLVLAFYAVPTALYHPYQVWQEAEAPYIINAEQKANLQKRTDLSLAKKAKYRTTEDIAQKPPQAFRNFWQAEAFVSILLATGFAVALPRFFFFIITRLTPDLRTQYQKLYGGERGDPVVTARDFLVVGVFTAGFYFGLLKLSYAFGPGASTQAGQWWTWRLPLVLPAGLAGILVGRLFAVRRDNLWSYHIGAWASTVMVFAHVAFLFLAMSPLLPGRDANNQIIPFQTDIVGFLMTYTGDALTLPIVGLLALLLLAGSFVVFVLAGHEDKKLERMQKENAEVQKEKLDFSILIKDPTQATQTQRNTGTVTTTGGNSNHPIINPNNVVGGSGAN